MRQHDDFSNGERGKFSNPNAQFKLPVCLDEQVQGYMSAKADAKGIDLSDLVNNLLKREIAIIQAVGWWVATRNPLRSFRATVLAH